MKTRFIYIFAILHVIIFISCDDDETNSFENSQIVGKWEFDYRTNNGKEVTINWDSYCIYDQLYEFHADGTVTSNNPCLQMDRAISKANWKIIGDKLSIDYYVIPYLSVNPVIISVDEEKMILQQMWGDNEVIHNVFRKTNKEVVDYAADLAGDYSGWMNYSNSVITNTERGDSMWIDLNIEKADWSTINITYKNIDVFGEIRTLKVGDILAYRDYTDRYFKLDEGIGSELLYINQDSIYNIRNEGSRNSLDPNLIRLNLNFTKIERQEPGNENSPVVENVYQFHQFNGSKR